MTKKKTIMNISSVLSYSYRFGNRHSLGLQAEVGYNKKETEKDIFNPSTVDYNNTDEIVESISGSFSMGYSYIGNNIESGLILNSGEISRKKTRLSYDTFNGSYYSGSNSTGTQYLVDKSFGFLAGIGFRPEYNCLIVLEGGVQFPIEYDTDSIQDKPAFLVINNKIKNSGIYLVRSGLDYQVNRSISAGIGAGYIYTSSKTENDTLNSDTRLHLISLTSGVELRLLNGLKLIFSCDLLYTIADLSMDMSVIEADLDVDTLSVNFVTGVSRSF